MKVKGLIEEIKELAEERGLEAVEELYTSDRTRIDVAILKEEKKLLAIEFERTYKWIRRRILYNGIKAYRAGFKDLLMIYPFSQNSVPNSWVMDYLEDIGMNIDIVHPDDCLKEILKLIKQQNSC